MMMKDVKVFSFSTGTLSSSAFMVSFHCGVTRSQSDASCAQRRLWRSHARRMFPQWKMDLISCPQSRSQTPDWNFLCLQGRSGTLLLELIWSWCCSCVSEQVQRSRNWVTIIITLISNNWNKTRLLSNVNTLLSMSLGTFSIGGGQMKRCYIITLSTDTWALVDTKNYLFIYFIKKKPQNNVITNNK